MSQPGNSQPSSLIGTCLTLPNLGFLWVFFKYPKISKNRNTLFFPVCKVPCLWAFCFRQLSTCLLWIFWSFLIWNVFFSLTCNNKAKCASFPWQKYHRDFLRYWAVKTYYQLLLLLNPVGKIAITTRPASSCFTAVSCSLLRIIFFFSLLT